MLILPPEIDRLLPTDEGKIALETLRDCYEDLESLATDKADIDALTAVKTALVALAAVYSELVDLAADPAIFPGDVKVADQLFINETANPKQGIGLTINQGANYDEIVSLKSSDVAHGMTDLTETDTFATFHKRASESGGLQITGLKDADEAANGALVLRGMLAETADTTKSAAGRGVAEIIPCITNGGTGITSVGADGNLLAIINYTSTKFLFDAEGELHSDAVIGAGDDWDDYDDLALAADLSRLPKAKWDETLEYHAEDLERAGLVTLSTAKDGTRHAFIKHKAMLMFYACCFRQVGERLARCEQLLLDHGIAPSPARPDL